MSSKKEEETGMGPLLTKQVLTRMSEEEYEAWAQGALDAGMPMNIFVRRIMGHALGMIDFVKDVDRRVAEGKLNRAAHMRQFRGRPGSEASAPGTPVAQRRAS